MIDLMLYTGPRLVKCLLATDRIAHGLIDHFDKCLWRQYAGARPNGCPSAQVTVTPAIQNARASGNGPSGQVRQRTGLIGRSIQVSVTCNAKRNRYSVTSNVTGLRDIQCNGAPWHSMWRAPWHAMWRGSVTCNVTELCDMQCKGATWHAM